MTDGIDRASLTFEQHHSWCGFGQHSLSAYGHARLHNLCFWCGSFGAFS